MFTAVSLPKGGFTGNGKVYTKVLPRERAK
jgi:hypothetical protein